MNIIKKHVLHLRGGNEQMKKKLLIICAIVLFLAGSANAAFTTYTDRPSWETAVFNYYWEEQFDDDELHPLIVSFTPSTSGGGVTGGVWSDVIDDSEGPSTITFAQPMNAFGGNWDLAGPGGEGTGIAVSIAVPMDETWVGEIDKSYDDDDNFWGFISDDYFTIIYLREGSNDEYASWVESYELDNMVFAPAPGAILLGSIGVGLVGWLRRRRTL